MDIILIVILAYGIVLLIAAFFEFRERDFTSDIYLVVSAIVFALVSIFNLR